MNTSRGAVGTVVGILAAGLILKLSLCETQGQNLRTISSQPVQITSQPLDASSVPSSGNFYLLSQWGQKFPPLPCNPYATLGVPVYLLDVTNHIYLVADSPEDYTALQQQQRAITMSEGRMSAMDASSGSDSAFLAPTYGSNDLWLEITNV
jgi:hypothetical protein